MKSMRFVMGLCQRHRIHGSLQTLTLVVMLQRHRGHLIEIAEILSATRGGVLIVERQTDDNDT